MKQLYVNFPIFPSLYKLLEKLNKCEKIINKCESNSLTPMNTEINLNIVY